MWMGVFSAGVTVIVGLLVSLLTGKLIVFCSSVMSKNDCSHNQLRQMRIFGTFQLNLLLWCFALENFHAPFFKKKTLSKLYFVNYTDYKVYR